MSKDLSYQIRGDMLNLEGWWGGKEMENNN